MVSESFRIFPSKDLSSFKRVEQILLWWLQWRKKCDVDSIYKLQVQSGLTQFFKLWLNLCSFRWLSPSLNYVSTQRPNVMYRIWWKVYHFKACVHYILSNLYWSADDSPSKTTKNVFFLFHLKSYFCSQDIQIFLFPSPPLFLPISHCFRGWLKINLKVYDIINCLNKNLIMYFVWYLEKEKRYDIET